MKKNAWRRICALLLTPLMMLTFLSIITASSASATSPPGTVVAWGYNSNGQTDVPADLAADTAQVIAVDGGELHSLALLSDGTVRSWGSQSPAFVPAELTNPATAQVTSISARGTYNLALRSDGTVTAWGSGSGTLPAELSVPATAHVIAISAGPGHSLAVRADGTVVRWGSGPTVPAALTDPATAHAKAVAAGNGHDLALLENGTVVSWGSNHDGQPVPAGLANAVAIAEGTYHSMALRADGTVVTWGYNHYQQVPAPGTVTDPATAHVIAITAGNYHSLALKADGTVIRWGDRSPGSNPVPASLSGSHVTALGAGDWHSLAIVGDLTAPTLNLPSDITVDATGPAGAAVSYTATATDTNPTSPAVSCTPPSGSTFSVGTTTVDCTATDAAGNTSSGTFTVTVVAPVSTDADISIEKSVQPGLAQPGDTMTYTLSVHNNGHGKATGVQVSDVLPAGTTYVSAPGCTQSGGTVTCALGTMTAGLTKTVTIKVSVDPVTSNSSHGHGIDVTKLETHLTLPPGTTRVETASCPAGSLAADGSVRIDHVDQDTGTLADVVVLGSQATGAGQGWIGTIRNDTTGQAQVKINVVCVSERTTSGDDHSHPLVLGDWVIGHAVSAGDTALTCPTGTLAISPSFIFTTGEGIVSTRRTTNGWRFTLTGPGTADVAVRCLSTTLGSANGHRHDLSFTHLEGTVSVPAGGIVETALTCPVGYKGITAWGDLEPGLVSLGNDPQPITRLFRFYNPTAAPLDADYGLACLGIRSWDGQITNTASVTSPTADPNLANNADSATFQVTTTGILVAPRAQVITTMGATKVKAHLASTRARSVHTKLVATSHVAGTSLRTGDVLARGTARLTSGIQRVSLGALDHAANALRNNKIHQAKLVITAADGTRTIKIVRLTA